MPRLIDHDKRGRDIADAAARVLARDGLASLSVRKVADEAGIATASLRRAFPTQDALRLFCLARIQEAVTARILAADGEGIPLALALLRELLPGDATRRTELAAQLQLVGLALTEPSLRQPVLDLDDAVRRVCAAAVAEALRGTPNPETITPETVAIEAEHLHALLDGLALHMLWDDTADAEARALSLLERHLLSLR